MESCVNYHSFYQLVGLGSGERGKAEEGFHHPIPLPTCFSTHNLVGPGGLAQAKVLGEKTLVLTLAQTLVSTLERPGSMPEIVRALGR